MSGQVSWSALPSPISFKMRLPQKNVLSGRWAHRAGGIGMKKVRVIAGMAGPVHQQAHHNTACAAQAAP